MEILNLLPSKEREYVKKVFSGCPQEIKDMMRLLEVEKDCNFIYAGTPCRYVYLLLKGKAAGIDMQIQGKTYRFKEFHPGRFLGEFECIADIPNYSITVQAETKCTLLVMTAQVYLKWMKEDGNAFFLRMQKLLYELTNQTKDDRRFFLSTCKERMIQYLVEYYGQENKQRVRIQKSRDELANEIGFVVRTIDRNVNKLAAEGYLSLQAGKLYVSRSQYEKLKAHLKQNYTYKED